MSFLDEVHDSSKPTWHVVNLNFMIVDLYL